MANQILTEIEEGLTQAAEKASGQDIISLSRELRELRDNRSLVNSFNHVAAEPTALETKTQQILLSAFKKAVEAGETADAISLAKELQTNEFQRPAADGFRRFVVIGGALVPISRPLG